MMARIPASDDGFRQLRARRAIGFNPSYALDIDMGHKTQFKHAYRFSVICCWARSSMTFVILDERQDSINDAYFVTEMNGYPNLATTTIVDWPASYHCRAAGFAFADGHSEIHKWTGSKIRNAPITFTATLPLNVPAGDSWVDVQ